MPGLKHALGADHACLKQFHATEAAFRAVLLLFDLQAEFQCAAGLSGYRQTVTAHTQVLTCGMILGCSNPPPGASHGLEPGWAGHAQNYCWTAQWRFHHGKRALDRNGVSNARR